MLHDDFSVVLVLCIRDEDASFLLVGGVPFLVKPQTRPVAATNFLFVVKNVKHVASWSGAMDQRQGAFLNDSSGAATIPDQLDNEQADFVVELRELKNFLLLVV